MARGDSGRVVIEVDSDLKSALYVALAADNATLKAWFIQEATRYVQRRGLSTLLAAEPPPKEYSPTPPVKD